MISKAVNRSKTGTLKLSHRSPAQQKHSKRSNASKSTADSDIMAEKNNSDGNLITPLDIPVPPCPPPRDRRPREMALIKVETLSDPDCPREAAICEAAFLRQCYKISQSSNISGLTVDVNIESIEVIQNPQLEAAYNELKATFEATQTRTTKERLFFYAGQYDHLVKVAKRGFDVQIISLNDVGIVLSKHPGEAFNRGLAIMVVKAFHYSSLDHWQIRATSPRTILPFGILNFTLDVVRGSGILSSMKNDIALKWVLTNEAVADVSNPIEVDVTTLTSEILRSWFRIQPNIDCLRFRANFIKSNVKMRELLQEEEYIALRDAETGAAPVPISFSATYVGQDLQKFLDLIAMKSKMDKKDFNRIKHICVVWGVTKGRMEEAVTLSLNLSCKPIQNDRNSIPDKLMRQSKVSLFAIPFRNEGFEECDVCRNIERGPWIAMIHCDHKMHTTCFKEKAVKSGRTRCPICKIVFNIAQGPQPENGTMEVRTLKKTLPGFPKAHTLVLAYDFPEGIQGSAHPNPGEPYKTSMFPLETYLPHNFSGSKVANLLKQAFARRLLFIISEGELIMNPMIEQKTSIKLNNGKGYPDVDFLDFVQHQLRSLGISSEWNDATKE